MVGFHIRAATQILRLCDLLSLPSRNEPKPPQKSGKDRTKIKAARAQNRRRKK